MIRLEDISAWLAAHNVVEPVYLEGVPDDTGRSRPPDALYALLSTGGLPMTVERAFERPTFQILSRGSDPSTARKMAYRLDALIVDAAIPLHIGESYVIDTGRVGGPPQLIEIDDKRRAYYSANYRMEVAR